MLSSASALHRVGLTPATSTTFRVVPDR